MHISEGVLSPGALAAGWTIAAAGTAVGLKKLKPERIVRVALMSSAFFMASLVNVKVGPSSTHLSLIAPMGLVLGWSAFPAAMVALLLQALLFSFGGLTVLGPNTVDIGVPALLVYLIFAEPIRRSSGKAAFCLAFVAGTLAVLLGAVGVGTFLGLTDMNFMSAAEVVLLAHIPVAFIEGAITAFMVSWMKKVSPEFLSGVDR
ncbi:MAG: cobalt transporter CbiM [Pyramidobacter sp.]|jgi:cobalt/nickel transport system permease protein